MRSLRVISSVTSDLVTDQRVHRICTTLARNSYKVELVGRRKKSSPDLDIRPYDTHRLSLRFEKGMLFYLEFNWCLFWYLLKSKADIFIANDLDTMPANFLIRLLKRKKLVYDSHEYFTEVPELIHRKFKRTIWKMVESLTIRSFDLGLTVSGSIADAYRKMYGVEMHVIRNLPTSYDFKEYRDKGAYKIDDPDKFRILFYQGSVNVARGLEEMIDAMAYLPLCKLFIAGDGDVLEALKEKVSVLDWKTRVIFLGRLSLNELRFYTVQADLGISIEKKVGLSYTYAMPNKFFDYVQANVPILISDLPELLKLNTEFKVAEVLSDHDPISISNTILHLFAETDKMDEIRKNLEYARKIWTWEEEEPKLIELVGHLSNRA